MGIDFINRINMKLHTIFTYIVNKRNIILFISNIIFYYILFIYLLPFESISQSIAPLYFYSVVKRFSVTTLNIIVSRGNISEERIIRLYIFCFIPFGLLLWFLSYDFWIEKVRSYLNKNIFIFQIWPDDEIKRWSDKQLSEVNKEVGPLGIYECTQETYNALKYKVENNIITQEQLKERLDGTIKKLDEVNARVLFNFEDLANIKYFSSKHEYSPLAKEYMGSLTNSEECKTKNRPYIAWVGIPKKRKAMKAELQTIRDTVFSNNN